MFDLLLFAIVFFTVVCFIVFASGPSAAQGLLPAPLPVGPDLPHRPTPALPAPLTKNGANATLKPKARAGLNLTTQPNAAESTLAPMPDLDIRAPADTTRHLGIGPVFTRQADPYRGETFNSDSTSNPGTRDQRFPISGFTLKLPLN